MEYISNKYKKECTAIQETKMLPMDWIQQFLEKLFTTNEKFVAPLPVVDYTCLTSSDIAFLLILSDVLMEYIIQMDPVYIEKIDSYITEYRRLIRKVYDHSSCSNPTLQIRMKSILNIS